MNKLALRELGNKFNTNRTLVAQVVAQSGSIDHTRADNPSQYDINNLEEGFEISYVSSWEEFVDLTCRWKSSVFSRSIMADIADNPDRYGV